MFYQHTLCGGWLTLVPFEGHPPICHKDSPYHGTGSIQVVFCNLIIVGRKPNYKSIANRISLISSIIRNHLTLSRPDLGV
jgi:hypothetical protein